MLKTQIKTKLIKTSIYLLIGLLAGCAQTQKDGPPRYNVDVSRISDAVPKVEPLSKNGNMASYRVFGKKYHVMRSSKGYEERGIASWYGSKFHAHSTSNGERYNMLAMTAAHKSLPLPTYVQVTNLTNGKKVIVKVNDRGPFEGNRLIDLSYVAAKKLGMLGHGTAYVDVKAIDPSEAIQSPELFAKNTSHSMYTNKNKTTITTSSVNSIAAPSMNIYLQVGAFRDRMRAEKLRQRLIAMTSSPVKINTARNLYRVQVGPFQDSASAKRFNQQLKSQGLT